MASKEEIEKAIEELVARGEEPSVRKVWAELGNSGSFIQINPILSAWKKARAAKSAPGSPVPDGLTETAVALVAKCWTIAEKKATEDAQDARRGADHRIDELEQEVVELEGSLEEAEFMVEKEKHENADMVQAMSASQQLVGELRSNLAGSAREIALLRERIAELSARPA
jgi:hypothetical protein